MEFKMKSKTSKAFQQALLVLTGKEKTCIKMMKKLPPVSHHVE